MLRPLLDAENVSRHALRALSALREMASRSTDPAPPGLPGTIDAASARDLAASLQSLTSLGQTPGSARDRHAFINSNPHLSLLQALLEEAAHTTRFAAPGADGMLTPAVRAVALPEDQRSALQRFTLARQQAYGVPAEEQFRADDIRWVEVLAEMARVWRKRIAYALPEDPVPFKLARDARIVLVSDWGNGSDVAVAVAQQIAEWVNSAGPRQCHVIHLGDTYYAGTPWESHDRFLANWPVVTVPSAVDCYSWVLAGNHDMYSAGEGIEAVLGDPRFRHQRSTLNNPTTRFLLRNDEIQVIGLDTSWQFDIFDPCNLHGQLGTDQTSWLAEQLPHAAHTVLLTHHQPVSRRQAAPAPPVTEDRLLAETESARASGALTAWFWGHEHRCMTYVWPPSVPGLALGCCTGHGAMPEPVPDPPMIVGTGEWEFTAAQAADACGDIWRRCGFTVLDLDPVLGTLVVQFIDQDGRQCRSPVELPLRSTLVEPQT